MNKEDLLILIRFNFWANGRILEACTSLTAEQWIQPLTPNPGWSTLQSTLVHALDTEYGWRMALEMNDDDQILQPADFPNSQTLKAGWDQEKDAWLNYLHTLNDDDLHRGYGSDPAATPKVWQTIMHVMTHSTQHRSEAAAILTGFGHSPGELDFYIFLQTGKH